MTPMATRACTAIRTSVTKARLSADRPCVGSTFASIAQHARIAMLMNCCACSLLVTSSTRFSAADRPLRRSTSCERGCCGASRNAAFRVLVQWASSCSACAARASTEAQICASAASGSVEKAGFRRASRRVKARKFARASPSNSDASGNTDAQSCMRAAAGIDAQFAASPSNNRCTEGNSTRSRPAFSCCVIGRFVRPAVYDAARYCVHRCSSANTSCTIAPAVATHTSAPFGTRATIVRTCSPVWPHTSTPTACLRRAGATLIGASSSRSSALLRISASSSMCPGCTIDACAARYSHSGPMFAPIAGSVRWKTSLKMSGVAPTPRHAFKNQCFVSSTDCWSWNLRTYMFVAAATRTASRTTRDASSPRPHSSATSRTNCTAYHSTAGSCDRGTPPSASAKGLTRPLPPAAGVTSSLPSSSSANSNSRLGNSSSSSSFSSGGGGSGGGVSRPTMAPRHAVMRDSAESTAASSRSHAAVGHTSCAATWRSRTSRAHVRAEGLTEQTRRGSHRRHAGFAERERQTPSFCEEDGDSNTSHMAEYSSATARSLSLLRISDSMRATSSTPCAVSRLAPPILASPLSFIVACGPPVSGTTSSVADWALETNEVQIL
eukprot:Rhum_TRINITY_DN14656_c22_g1::Rhum_TRINITY_DN14656_c22_g1_i1::g.108050::m.108050